MKGMSVDDGKKDAVPAAPLGRVLLIGPQPPPYGGMALQARLMLDLMQKDAIPVTFLACNPSFPQRLRFLEWLRGLRPLLRFLLFCPKLWKQVRQANVVHILSASWLYFFLVVCPAIIISRIHGKRVILNYRGGEAERFLRWYGLFVKPFFKMADIVAVPSGFLVEVIQHRVGIPVSILPNPIDLALFRYRKRPSLRPRMLVTRNLEKLYDHETVLRAFRLVLDRYPEASLWIAGTGTQETYLRALISVWNLRNVLFLGHVPHEDLPKIYDQCDIVLNASRVDNFPASLLEASACGLVVISTLAGGIPFIYENEKCALLVELGDWKGLASKVDWVLGNPHLAQRLTAEALQRSRQCDWKNIRELLYRMYGFRFLEASQAGAGTAKMISPTPSAVGTERQGTANC